jgi:predicted RecB family nuclease
MSGEKHVGNTYAEWLSAHKEAYRQEGIRTLTPEADAADRMVPIRFVFANKLSRIDRLLLAFDAWVLAKNTGTNIEIGKIIHGDDYAVSKIKLTPLIVDVRKTIGKVTALISNTDPPKLALNRHCPECEFQDRCSKQASEKDDLSLLSGLSEKERGKLNKKGIFSVTQLSYTFRPRRRSKIANARPEKYHPALKALSIREQKTHIAGVPQLAIEGTAVLLDVEALPDRDFYYLIGLRVKTGGDVMQHSLWANDAMEEGKIWQDFLHILSRIPNPVLIHYGSFETTFLKRMAERYGIPPEESAATKAIKSPINVVSVIFARVYFPTYSNSLKEIARHLGFQWSDPTSSGLHSLVWRYQWEQSHDPTLRDRLITYNANDCEALGVVTDVVLHLAGRDFSSDTAQKSDSNIVHTDSLKINPAARLGTFKSTVSGLEHINNASLWDYQRDKIYVRSGVKPKSKPMRVERQTDSQTEKTVMWEIPTQCPQCGKKWRTKGQLVSRTVHELIYGKSSLKRKVVKYMFQTYRCRSCKHVYGLDKRFGRRARKYGWGVYAYLIYNIIGLYVSQYTAVRSLNKLLGFDLHRSNINYIKTRAAKYYQETRDGILHSIISGNLIHADETRANIKGRRAYVWVLTNMQEVVYILAESREGELIKNMLQDFKGVLVSDFYAAYDSIECPQQKCLIHIMRDLNDDIFKNPFDEELKKIVVMFADLLKPIIATIDKHGLKKYFLKKHLRDVEQFYKTLDNSSINSEMALKYKQRFVKNRDKLFTFLRYDGVPWNNNNAEHAIKSFALLRNVISGPSTKKGTEEYLTLLSVCRTCEYQGADFLDFLRSGEKDVSVYVSKKCRL